MTRQVVILVLGSMLAIATALNVYAGGMLYPDETCTVAHPILFGFKVSAIWEFEELSLLPIYLSSSNQDLNMNEEDLRYFDFQSLPEDSCVEEYGFHNPNTNSFQLTLKGYDTFAPWLAEIISPEAVDNATEGYSEEERQAYIEEIRPFWEGIQSIVVVEVSPLGRFWLYFLLPLYLVLLPVLTIRLSRRAWGLWWYIMVSLVTLLAVTSALLYVNYADITGIEAFSDFGTGVFGGTITATALAFLSHLVDIFSAIGDD